MLGGLVDFDTGQRITDEWQFAKAAADAPENAGLGIVMRSTIYGTAARHPDWEETIRYECPLPVDL